MSNLRASKMFGSISNRLIGFSLKNDNIFLLMRTKIIRHTFIGHASAFKFLYVQHFHIDSNRIQSIKLAMKRLFAF